MIKDKPESYLTNFLGDLLLIESVKVAQKNGLDIEPAVSFFNYGGIRTYLPEGEITVRITSYNVCYTKLLRVHIFFKNSFIGQIQFYQAAVDWCSFARNGDILRFVTRLHKICFTGNEKNRPSYQQYIAERLSHE